MIKLSKKDFNYWRRITSHIVVAVLGWAIFSVIHSSISDFLTNMGILSNTGQYSIIIIGAVVILLLLGYGGKKIADSI